MLISQMDKLMSLDARGQFGFTAAAGFARCGYSRCGGNSRFGGIYQRHATANGPALVRARYMRPTNPQTEAQQAWRAIFAVGIAAWQALDESEKVLLSKEARHYRMTGSNLFMRRWLQSRRG